MTTVEQRRAWVLVKTLAGELEVTEAAELLGQDRLVIELRPDCPHPASRPWTEAVQRPARVNERCVTPLGEDIASPYQQRERISLPGATPPQREGSEASNREQQSSNARTVARGRVTRIRGQRGGCVWLQCWLGTRRIAEHPREGKAS